MEWDFDVRRGYRQDDHAPTDQIKSWLHGFMASWLHCCAGSLVYLHAHASGASRYHGSSDLVEDRDDDKTITRNY